MKSTLTICAVILGIWLIGIIYLPLQAQEENSKLPVPASEVKKEPTKWQHLALQHDASKPFSTPDLARQINKLGEEGWEMVNVLNFQEEGTTTKTVYYFKRPL
jgi:hypothetical protein